MGRGRREKEEQRKEGIEGQRASEQYDLLLRIEKYMSALDESDVFAYCA